MSAQRMARASMGTAQRGVVLISMLLILALLTALAYRMVARHSLVVAQARQSFAGDQAISYALGGEAFARQILFQDWSESGRDIDTLQEAWAQPLAPFEIEEGFLEIQIRDLSSCFNLNAVADVANPANLIRLKTLLRNLNLPENLADVWRDWVDPDQDITAFGAEDGDYLLLEPPYRTANALAGDVSELALLKDMDPEWLAVLRANTCVLPTTELKLNVNTATAAALAALNPALTEAQLLPVTQSERRYANVNEVTAEIQELAPAIDALAVTSQYFEVSVRAQVDDSLAELSSVLRRDPGNGHVTLISRNFGKEFRTLFQDDSLVDE